MVVVVVVCSSSSSSRSSSSRRSSKSSSSSSSSSRATEVALRGALRASGHACCLSYSASSLTRLSCLVWCCMLMLMIRLLLLVMFVFSYMLLLVIFVCMLFASILLLFFRQGLRSSPPADENKKASSHFGTAFHIEPTARGDGRVHGMFCRFACFVWVGGAAFVWMECPAWCSGGRRPLISGCSSLQRLGMDLAVTRPVWDAKLGPPASDSRSSSQLSYRCH